MHGVWPAGPGGAPRHRMLEGVGVANVNEEAPGVAEPSRVSSIHPVTSGKVGVQNSAIYSTLPVNGCFSFSLFVFTTVCGITQEFPDELGAVTLFLKILPGVLYENGTTRTPQSFSP